MISYGLQISPVISPEMLRLVAELDEFRAQWKAFKAMTPERLTALRHSATIESIGSSTRIEGSKLSDRQVADLLKNLATTSFRSRDEQEVAGYAEVMDLIFDSWDQLSVTENHILQLHRNLLRHAAKDESHRGIYKKLPNHVSAFDADGRELGVVFETCSPFETPMAMERLCRWLAQAEADRELHPLLITGIFTVWFLAIHPFLDGNGRLSRVLTTLLLLRAGYHHVPYASLESVIEQNKDTYYLALRQTQTTFGSASPDWTPWLTFFLRCLVRQKNNLLGKMQAAQVRMENLTPMAARLMELAGERGRLTVAEAATALGEATSRNTIKAALQSLVKRGWLVLSGKGRGAFYTQS
ncbi:MAG: Fic family protein [Verrucomicrobiaceae bacterium]|nr:MAG: Fic family protein [Verrucomicrobiaceae bacterium]